MKKAILTTPIKMENIKFYSEKSWFGGWEISANLKLEKIEKLPFITALLQQTHMDQYHWFISLKAYFSYKIKLEDIVKRINFTDLV